MKKNPRYQTKHISIRVPWHDSKWEGCICRSPKENSACLILANCAQKRDDETEAAHAGASLNVLQPQNYPACTNERGTFMADFEFSVIKKHPYADFNLPEYANLKPTPLTFPAYSAAAVPFHWMLKRNLDEYVERYELDYKIDLEPNLPWLEDQQKGWVQALHNQKALLNCFFEHLEVDTSLVIFYAKQVPFLETGDRVIVGVGRVKRVMDSPTYNGSNAAFSTALWEHTVFHSIRPEMEDGFLLPYHEALEYQKLNPTFDPATLVVTDPPDKRHEFSYVAEHVSNDSAIRVLRECYKSITLAKELNIGKGHDLIQQWIHNELQSLESLRGSYPGLGAALCAFGIAKGHFVATELLTASTSKNEDPWILFERALDGHPDLLSDDTQSLVKPTTRKLFQALVKKADPERLRLLRLLSQFDLSKEQMALLYKKTERETIDSEITDGDILENPYLIYELLRHSTDPVSFETIDLGMFSVKQPFPMLISFDDPLDLRRIRGIIVRELEAEADLGSTIVSRQRLIKRVQALPLVPPCELDDDYLDIAQERIANTIQNATMKDGKPAYQLDRYFQSKTIIGKSILGRMSGSPHVVSDEWSDLLSQRLGTSVAQSWAAREEKAREEKLSALRTMASSRFCVLVGPAGTGKTTVLSTFASHSEIQTGGILFLAPTGKARVRMTALNHNRQIEAKTVAQFLKKYDRYDTTTMRYVYSAKRATGIGTVIVDESSMLTEDMLSTLLDCVSSARRVILVGDHRQLPPIGAGKPFFDIVRKLRPANVEGLFPRVSSGYAELTLGMRQNRSSGEERQLSDWFAGEELQPGDDDLMDSMLADHDSGNIRLVQWQSASDFEEALDRVLVEELKLNSLQDSKTFNCSLGSSDGLYFNNSRDAQHFNTDASVDKIEDWQILSPVKEQVHGSRSLNRHLHEMFRKQTITSASSPFQKHIPRPIGLEDIVYGDKVINVKNHSRRCFPSDSGAMSELANGEIGVVTGKFYSKAESLKDRPEFTEVEFASQRGYVYRFEKRDFDEERNDLELAYALTIHKCQGSEFRVVILILPNPCFLLSRELLYTALTRQTERVIILSQGSILDLKELSSPLRSETLRRMTNLFDDPLQVEVHGKYLDKNLIHQATDGTMLRSKSELLIYQRLLDRSFNVAYEKPLKLGGISKLPDFTIEDIATGKLFYWEHCGMLYDPVYLRKWEDKCKWYAENGIRTLRDGGGLNGTLIVSQDTPATIEDGSVRGAFSVKEVDKLIDSLLG